MRHVMQQLATMRSTREYRKCGERLMWERRAGSRLWQCCQNMPMWCGNKQGRGL